MPRFKHVHKYYRMPFSDGYVWACGSPGCNHHIPRYMEASIRQKQSICWKCGDYFFFADNILALDMQNPVCMNCAPDSIAKSITNDFDAIANSSSLEPKRKTPNFEEMIRRGEIVLPSKK